MDNIHEIGHQKACEGSISLYIHDDGGFKDESNACSNEDNVVSQVLAAHAPEKKLTLFALRLAILEKAASGLGTLGFIWATVVLLGGFAITLDKSDFWFITVILLIEGTRIFSRSHELEWQHQATWSVTSAGINSFRAFKSTTCHPVNSLKKISCIRKPCKQGKENVEGRSLKGQERMPNRAWANTDVPLLPYANWVFLSRNVSKLLYWLQLLSAVTCVVLSLMKLIMHNFGEIAKGDSDKRNRKAALYIFYSLALAEALLFLLEKAYWEYKVIYCGLLEEVNKECELGYTGMVSIKRFFYDSYSKCVNGSIFDGLKMDMVSFGMDLLCSSSPEEQLIGARILRQFAFNEQFSDDTLEKIGTTPFVIERLVDMLNWEEAQEVEIRKSAAEILSRLVGKRQNSLRVAKIPGAIESISSILQTNRCSCEAADEMGESKIINDHAKYGISTFNNLGLLILKNLANYQDNCGKIGNARGLLPKIIEFTHAEDCLLKNENVSPSQILTVELSLQVVKMLVINSGDTGKQLRKEISEIIFTISNIRDILHNGDKHPVLQELGIEILTSLAFEDDATEMIGGTGGMLNNLLNIFFNDGIPEMQIDVKSVAGEALAMLVLESENNCRRVLKSEVLEKLIRSLEIPFLQVHAARILTNLCIYSPSDCFNYLSEITSAAPTVLMAIMAAESKLQEVMMGLATQIFKFLTPRESIKMFERARIMEAELACRLVHILKTYPYPTGKVPKIRRYAIELAIWMMKDKRKNIHIFEDLGMKEELKCILETTAEIENFHMFSGIMGLSRYSTTMESLVDVACDLLASR